MKVLKNKRIDIPKIQSVVRSRFSQEQLHEKIAQKAYEFFQQRGCRHGYDLQDWLEAEKIIKGA